MAQDCPLVTLGIRGPLAKLTLNNPPLNILTNELRRQLLQRIQEVEEERKLRVMILGSAVDKAFSVGSDLGEFPHDEIGGLQKIQYEQYILDRVERLNLVTIACLKGFVLGGGAELMLACDLRIAREDTRIAFPEVTVGGFPAAGGVARLARDIGLVRAREMLFFGKTVSAKDALAVGLINDCVGLEELDARADSLAQQLLELPQSSLLAIKRTLHAAASGEPNSSATARVEAEEFARLYHHEDISEGIRAFFEKRPPRFNKKYTSD